MSLYQNTSIVGMPGYSKAGIFERISGSWSKTKEVCGYYCNNTGLAGSIIYGDTLYITSGHGYPFWIYTRLGSDWVSQATISPTNQDGSSDFDAGGFGSSISAYNNTLLVGAPKTKCGNGSAGCGAVYIYTRSGTTWSIQQKITAQTTGGADDSQPGAEFGTSVSVDGNTLIVGASLKSCAAGADCGAAYVYTRTGTTWNIQQKLTAQMLPGVDDLQADAWFGEAVAISGNTALVGASHYDCVGLNDCGAAYMYVRSGSLWTLQQKLIARDTFGTSDEGDWAIFGRSVALQGDTALVGSPYAFGCLPGVRCGAAYLYARSGNTWAIQQKVTAQKTDGTSDQHAYDYFGAALAIYGDTFLVGAPYVDNSAGAAYAYVFSPGSTLSVGKSGPGSDSSSITSNPAGITCGTACQANYVNGTNVTLTPGNPGSGYAFAGWGGACAGSDPCTVTLNSDLSVTARYAALSTTTLSVNPANSIFGQSIDLSAVVSGTNPQGTVTFKDGAISLGSSSIAGATAMLSTSGLLAGNHSLTAVYEGDDNNAGSVSNAVNFNVAKAPQALVSINAPASARYQESGLAVFGYGGSGSGAFTYSTAGSTACTVHPTSGALTITSGSGSCQVTATRLADTNYQEASSAAAIIQVNKALQSPLSVSANPPTFFSGGPGTTLGYAGGSTSGSVSYQVSGSPVGLTCTISGSTLTATGGAGSCSVTATMAGNTNYEPVTSSVLDVPVVAGVLTGLAAQGYVGTNNQVQFGAFTISGESRRVLIRGLGPALDGYVPNAIRNPKIALSINGELAPLEVNDDWADADNADEIATLKHQPKNEKESAILRTLEPGVYNVHLSGSGGTEGIGMFQVYAVEGGGNGELKGLAAQGQVGTGNQVQFGAFTITGGPRKVLIRGLGPALDPYILGAIRDPKIALSFNGADTPLEVNDDWADADNVEEIMALKHQPKNATESAILRILEPGVYNVHLSGSGGTEGIGMFQVYTVE